MEVFCRREGFGGKLNVNIRALLCRSEKDIIFVGITKGRFLKVLKIKKLRVKLKIKELKFHLGSCRKVGVCC